MRTSCVKNDLLVSVILLFIGIILSPVITAVDIEKANAENIDYNYNMIL